jgi:hypothetical protein
MQGCLHASQTSAGRVYRPRKPRATALYQCAARHAPELRTGGRFGRRVEENVIERFLACGDPQHGFARVYCDHCRHGFILAFSCKARYFCPSCHQKRVLAYGEWVEANVLYAASRGAAKVVCLEPEAAGATHGVRKKFDEVVGTLGLRNIAMLPTTFQDFDPGPDKFDVIVLNASINHLDEEACVRLHREESARRVYREIFAEMYRLAADGAALVIADCARRNFFGDLGRRNPFNRTIEWHKHQSPRFWASLLGEVGFRDPWIRWPAFNSLREPGRLLLGHAPVAYFFGTYFYLTMRK